MILLKSAFTQGIYGTSDKKECYNGDFEALIEFMKEKKGTKK